MNFGFDMDGVLCDFSQSILALLHHNGNKDEMLYYKERKPLLNPFLFMTEDDRGFCITSRPYSKYVDVTRQWMEKYYPAIVLCWLQKEYDYTDIVGIATEKIEKIKFYNIGVYIDDSPEIVSAMRQIAINKDVNVQIIQYGGRL